MTRAAAESDVLIVEDHGDYMDRPGGQICRGTPVPGVTSWVDFARAPGQHLADRRCVALAPPFFAPRRTLNQPIESGTTTMRHDTSLSDGTPFRPREEVLPFLSPEFAAWLSEPGNSLVVLFPVGRAKRRIVGQPKRQTTLRAPAKELIALLAGHAVSPSQAVWPAKSIVPRDGAESVLWDAGLSAFAGRAALRVEQEVLHRGNPLPLLRPVGADSSDGVVVVGSAEACRYLLVATELWSDQYNPWPPLSMIHGRSSLPLLDPGNVDRLRRLAVAFSNLDLESLGVLPRPARFGDRRQLTQELGTRTPASELDDPAPRSSLPPLHNWGALKLRIEVDRVHGTAGPVQFDVHPFELKGTYKLTKARTRTKKTMSGWDLLVYLQCVYDGRVSDDPAAVHTPLDVDPHDLRAIGVRKSKDDSDLIGKHRDGAQAIRKKLKADRAKIERHCEEAQEILVSLLALIGVGPPTEGKAFERRGPRENRRCKFTLRQTEERIRELSLKGADRVVDPRGEHAELAKDRTSKRLRDADRQRARDNHDDD